METTGVVLRERLARTLAAAPVGLIEAPGGYGKTTLLRQTIALREVPHLAVTFGAGSAVGSVGLDELWAHLARAAQRSGWPALARVLAAALTDQAPRVLDGVLEQVAQRADAVLVVVDEVQRATAEAAGWLRALASELPPGSALLVAGRRLPSPLVSWPDRPGTVHLDRQQLRFGQPEVVELFRSRGIRPDDDLVGDVLAITDGWPAAVGLATSLLEEGGPGLVGVMAGTGLLDSMLRRLLADQPTDVRARIRLLAHLPLLDDEVASAVAGPGAFQALVDAGIPWSRRADGWYVVPDAVRDVLGAGAALSIAQRRDAAAAYRARGQMLVALTLLSEATDDEGVVELLHDCSWRQLVELGLGTVRVVVGRLPRAALERRPGMLVQAARLAEQTDPALRGAWLELARDLAVSSGDHVVERAALAEMSRDAIRVGEDARVEELAAHVLAAAAPDELVTRGRVLAALGQLDTIRAGPNDLLAAEQKLEEAALLFRIAGERELEADALLRLGYAVSFHGGNFERAINQLHEVLLLLPTPDRPRGDALTYLADVLDISGRPDEAEAAAREALAIGRRIGDSWVIGAARWAAMLVAGHRGDLDGMRTWLGQVEQHPAPWMEVGAGLEFFVDASDLFAANGDEVSARHYFERASERAEALGIPEALSQLEHRIEATFGDPVRAEALLVAAEGSSYAVQRNRWVRSLLRALAAHRRGDTEAARHHAAVAVREAEQLGDAGIVWRLERRTAEILGAYLPAVPGAHAASWSIRVLGTFVVQRNGTDVTPPPGHPSTLVKLLALRAGMSAEEVIDQLWPEVSLEAGRSRLRNLLNRLRDRTGPLVVRHHGRLELDAAASVDMHRFESLANEVLAASPEDRPGLARRGLAIYGGELLPGDRYEDWTAAVRERLRRRYVTLVDLVVEDARQRGDLDEAMAWLDAALLVEPHDEHRYLVAAAVLAQQGRRRAAREMVERALASVTDLGVTPTPALLRRAQELGVTMAVDGH